MINHSRIRSLLAALDLCVVAYDVESCVQYFACSLAGFACSMSSWYVHIPTIASDDDTHWKTVLPLVRF